MPDGRSGSATPLPQRRKATAVICKNPLCMRIFVVPFPNDLKGDARVQLTCPGCKREHEYQMKDFHEASGPGGVALNPV